VRARRREQGGTSEMGEKKAVASKAVASLDTCAKKRRRDEKQERAHRRRTERVGRKASSTYTYRVCLSEAASRSGVVFAQVATKYITWSSMCGRRKQRRSIYSSISTLVAGSTR